MRIGFVAAMSSSPILEARRRGHRRYSSKVRLAAVVFVRIYKHLFEGLLAEHLYYE